MRTRLAVLSAVLTYAVIFSALGQVREGLATVELRMRPLSPAQAARYVALDRPEGCVGGYTFEQRSTGSEAGQDRISRSFAHWISRG